MNAKQKERRQRGEDFQLEIMKSWRLVPNVWTMVIKDGGGGARPADRIILTEPINILAELKRTKSRRFELSYLRPNQIQGLIDFDKVIERNVGLVFVSFHDPDEGLDKAYAFRLAEALLYMREKGTLYITLDELESNRIVCAELPRNESETNTYDLKGVIECFKSS